MKLFASILLLGLLISIISFFLTIDTYGIATPSSKDELASHLKAINSLYIFILIGIAFNVVKAIIHGDFTTIIKHYSLSERSLGIMLIICILFFPIIQSDRDNVYHKMYPPARPSADFFSDNNWLRWSEYAIKNKDWETAYLDIENLFISPNEESRTESMRLLKKYPQLMDAAKKLFSEKRLSEYATNLGDDHAGHMVKKRLIRYKTVAQPADYVKAESNFLLVFPEQKIDSTMVAE